jgi:intraflagellar transport protein 88
MTSNRGAGFSSAPRAKFDPLGGPGRSALAANGPSSLLPRKGKASPEEAARDMERRVHALLEDSAAAHARGEQQQGEPGADEAVYGEQCAHAGPAEGLGHAKFLAADHNRVF